MLGSSLTQDEKSSGTAKKKKKKKDKKKSSEESSGDVKGPPIDSSRHVSASDVVNAALHKDTSKQGTDNDQSGSQGGLEVTSRDELLDHLLAMGFVEANCLEAIKVCGLDVDRAISWLCEPSHIQSDPPAQRKANKSNTVLKDANKNKAGISLSNAAHSHPKSTSAVVDGGSKNTVQADSELTPAQKAQRDRDHKEELRRINREWNARVPQQRAEEEKKKAEEKSQAERAQKEIERQRQLQQQLQAQYSMHSMFNAGPPLPQAVGPAGASFTQQHIPGTFSLSQQHPPSLGTGLLSQQTSPPQPTSLNILGSGSASGSFPLMPPQASQQSPRHSIPSPPGLTSSQQQPSFSRGSSGGNARQGVGPLPSPSFGMPSQHYNPQASPGGVNQTANELLSSGTSGNIAVPPGIALGNVSNNVPLNTSQNNSIAPAVGTSNPNVMHGGIYNSSTHTNIPQDNILSSTLLNPPIPPQPSSVHRGNISSTSNSSQASTLFSVEGDRMVLPLGSDGCVRELGSISSNNGNLDVAINMNEDEYVDGGLNLSAGARPFVPQFTTTPSPKVSPQQHFSSGSSSLKSGAPDSLSLPPLGGQSYATNHDWNVELNAGGGSNTTGTVSNFHWKAPGAHDTIAQSTNASVDEPGFDMMSMNLDMLGGIDDLLQSENSGGGDLSLHGSLLNGLVSGGLGGSRLLGSDSIGSDVNQQQLPTSRFVNFGEDDNDKPDIFQTESNQSTNMLSSSLSDFMNTMGDQFSDYSPNDNDNVQYMFGNSNNNR